MLTATIVDRIVHWAHNLNIMKYWQTLMRITVIVLTDLENIIKLKNSVFQNVLINRQLFSANVSNFEIKL